MGCRGITAPGPESETSGASRGHEAKQGDSSPNRTVTLSIVAWPDSLAAVYYHGPPQLPARPKLKRFVSDAPDDAHGVVDKPHRGELRFADHGQQVGVELVVA